MDMRTRAAVYEKPLGSDNWFVRFPGRKDQKANSKREAQEILRRLRRNKTFGFRWQHREIFEILASRPPFSRDPSDLARMILNEFMACFLTDKELEEAGLIEYVSLRWNGLLKQAISRGPE
jgi:hypothetical protein